MTTKYDTRETAVASLTKNKKPDCVTALTAEFDAAVARGLSFREATYFAETTHFLRDHDGHNNLPQLKPGETEETIISGIEADFVTNDGEFKTQAESLLRWFKLIRTWDVPTELALTTALAASIEEYDDTNDLDEVEAIQTIEKIGDEQLKNQVFIAFYQERNAGNSVRASLRTAKEAAEEALQLQMLLSLFSGGLSGSEGFIN